MKESFAKYIALLLLSIYQLNFSHHFVTIVGHEFVHLIEDHTHHEHHQHHIHDNKHHEDHEHHVLFTFDASFEDHSDHNAPESEKSTALRINKHLITKGYLETVASMRINSPASNESKSIIPVYMDIPTPPPQQT